MEETPEVAMVIKDVFDRPLSLGDGAVYVITVGSRHRADDVKKVGALIPEETITHPRLRLVNLMNFHGEVPGAFRQITRTTMRNELQEVFDRRRPEYRAAGLEHDPSQNIFAAADFEGETVEALGLSATDTRFQVLLFDSRGRLVGQWQEVPEQDDLLGSLNPLL